MQRAAIAITLILLLLAGCKSQKKYMRYETLYSEAPQRVQIAPLFDLSTRKENPDSALCVAYGWRDTIHRYGLLSLPIGLKQRGYEVSGGDSLMGSSRHETRRLRQLQGADLSPLCVRDDIGAVLIAQVLNWKDSRTHPVLFLEYQLRSTLSGRDLMHCWVQVERTIDTTYKGQLIALDSERRIADSLHVSLECAIRCNMIEQCNIRVLQDLPFTTASFHYEKDRYLYAIHDYVKIEITNEGALDISRTTMDAYESACFF